jgi:hypothetical protein
LAFVVRRVKESDAVYFWFCFLISGFVLARRDSVPLRWAPFNQTGDGPGQNKHTSQTAPSQIEQ